MSINIDFAYSITAAINKGMLGGLAHKQTHTHNHTYSSQSAATGSP